MSVLLDIAVLQQLTFAAVQTAVGSNAATVDGSEPDPRPDDQPNGSVVRVTKLVVTPRSRNKNGTEIDVADVTAIVTVCQQSDRASVWSCESLLTLVQAAIDEVRLSDGATNTSLTFERAVCTVDQPVTENAALKTGMVKANAIAQRTSGSTRVDQI